MQVLNEDAETFLALIKEWKILCEKYGSSEVSYDEHSNVDTDSEEDDSTSVFVVEKLLDICFGDPDKMGQVGLKFKVSLLNIFFKYVMFFQKFLFFVKNKFLFKEHGNI